MREDLRAIGAQEEDAGDRSSWRQKICTATPPSEIQASGRERMAKFLKPIKFFTIGQNASNFLCVLLCILSTIIGMDLHVLLFLFFAVFNIWLQNCTL